jgi:molybdate-binding protein
MKKIKRIQGTIGVRATASEMVLGFNKISALEVDQLIYKQEKKVDQYNSFYDIHFKGKDIYTEKGMSSFRIEQKAMWSNIKLIFQGNLN